MQGKVQSKCNTNVAQRKASNTALGGMFQAQVQHRGTGKTQLVPPGDVKLSASDSVYNSGDINSTASFERKETRAEGRAYAVSFYCFISTSMKFRIFLKAAAHGVVRLYKKLISRSEILL